MSNIVKRAPSHLRLARPQLRTVSPAHGLPTTAGWHLPCNKLLFTFCEQRSRDAIVRKWLADGELASLARRYPSVEFVVGVRSHRVPVIKTFYANGRARVRPLYDIQTPLEIWKACEASLAESGNAYGNFLGPRAVVSQNDNPRGVWSPLHKSETGLRDPLPGRDGRW